MSDISITATSVVAGSENIVHGILGETVTAGQPLYKKASDSKWYKADNNAGTAEARLPIGVALNGGSVNQRVSVQKSGPCTIGATLTAGVVYYLSGTAGGICPVADLTTGMYPTVIGIATSTTVLDIDIQASGVAL